MLGGVCVVGKELEATIDLNFSLGYAQRLAAYVYVGIDYWLVLHGPFLMTACVPR